MDWRDIAAIVFIATAVNHLGLIQTIEGLIKRELPVINCPKCLTCWCVMAYQLVTGCNPLTALAVSLLCSFAAMWLELMMYAMNTLYNWIYGKIEEESGREEAGG